MAFTTARLSEVPLRASLPLTSHSSSLRSLCLLKPSCSVSTTESKRRHSGAGNTIIHKSSPYTWMDNCQNLRNPKSGSRDPGPSTASGISIFFSENRSLEPNDKKWGKTNGEDRTEAKDSGSRACQSAIDRIVLRLRNLGLGSDLARQEEEKKAELDLQDTMPVSGEEKLGDLLSHDWFRPDCMLKKGEEDNMVLPWERGEEMKEQQEEVKVRKRTVKAPTLAELTIEDAELRRLRRMGQMMKVRISVPKAGLTQAVLEKIHDRWRKEELVRLKFHESLAQNMKTAHELVERRTGGLVIWRSGSAMVVFRGNNYEAPSRSLSVNEVGGSVFVPDVSSISMLTTVNRDGSSSTLENRRPIIKSSQYVKSLTEEEVEFNELLDSLGPRFVEWWGTGVPPIDADLLAPIVPGYKTPFRLLPTGMRSGLTNAELTNLRKFSRSLPCHFALGRNRNHQGLAAAILKLWEKSLVVKIAVKQGILNTNNELMAAELKRLTGGLLLLRNKYYIVMYRGKDFLPVSVASTLAERQEFIRQAQDREEEIRNATTNAILSHTDKRQPAAGTLAEFYEAQSRWGRGVSEKEREKMIEEASKAERVRVMMRIKDKLALAQEKKLRAERILAKIEASLVPVRPSDDKETITDEERFMLCKVGLKMKAYLHLGVRGVFDGIIENMHLHWKHRELVKFITTQKTLAFVEGTARLLEYESGGILVAIERVPKGHILIYYRGKNYQRPISLRPRGLLTKAEALKRAVSMQRYEAFSKHVLQLEKTIEQMNLEIVNPDEAEDANSRS